MVGNPFKLLAQSPPNPIIPREPELPVPNLPVPQPNPLEPSQSTPVQPAPVPESSQTIVVERFEFEGNTAFSDETLTAVTQPFIGKPITFAELLQVESAITQKYVEAGYINSGAVIPANQSFPQDRAVVRVQIVEGGLAEIRITGNRRLNSAYVRSRLAIATKPPLNRDRLLEALQLLQLDPLIESISAELQPGVIPSSSRLEVRINEADTFDTEIVLDNERSPSVGSFRRGIRIRERNLTGLGDAIELSYANTDGSHDYDVNYTIPINSRNGTIGLGASYTETEVIEPPFDRIDIEGKSLYLNVSFRQPLILKPTREFALGVTASHQQSQTFIQEEPFPLAAGADEEGRTRISAVRFFQDYVQRNPKEVFAARSQFSLGLDLFDATINEEAPDGRFFAWRGQAQYVRQLAPQTLLLFRADAQLTPDSLVSLEQIGLGGLRSVRGYRQDILLTDNGVFFSLEARIPILRVRNLSGVLQVAPFVDFGVGWNNRDRTPLDKNTLAGIGLGLLWQMGDDFSARIDYGIPLIDVDSGDRTLQEKGFYFQIRYNPF
ncbi:MAG TPA: ShlB/FhaC/HecB family hemolysin secretion/activation protein [Leptolyngbyaceae cyanobacterium]